MVGIKKRVCYRSQWKEQFLKRSGQSTCGPVAKWKKLKIGNGRDRPVVRLRGSASRLGWKPLCCKFKVVGKYERSQ